MLEMIRHLQLTDQMQTTFLVWVGRTINGVKQLKGLTVN